MQTHHGQTFKAYRTFQDDKVVGSRFVDMTLDELDPGDVVIRTKYSTINYKDALSHNGTGKIMRKYPTVAGIDMAGTVETSADARFKRATRSSCTATTWASRTTAATRRYVRVPADWVVRRPGEHDGVRRDDARHRGLHRGARHPPHGAQRPDAGQAARSPSPARPAASAAWPSRSCRGWASA